MRMTNVSLFTMDLSTHNSLNDKVICRLPFYLFQLHLLASPHFDYSLQMVDFPECSQSFTEV